MKKAKQVALIGGGSLSDFPLAQIRWLSEQLGPVKASSLRLASRIANGLGAGRPVKEYRELDSARFILIAVPSAANAGVVAELLAAPMSWRGKTVALLSAAMDSGALTDFSARGANVATLCAIAGFERSYLIEGDPPAVRATRRLIESRTTRVIVVERENKGSYLLAEKCTGRLFFALVSAASDCLHYAGLSRSASAPILERQFEESLRAYLRGGLRARPSPCDVDRALRSLTAEDPNLARYLEDSVRLARQIFGDRDQAGSSAARSSAVGV